MKNFLVILAVALPLLTSAQGGRLKGGKFFQAGLGFRGAGPLVSAYGGMTFSTNVKGMVGGGLGIGKQADIDYKFAFLDGIGSFSLYSVNRTFFINAQAGVSFNADMKNEFESIGYSKNFSLNYGVLGGLETEFYATRNLLFVLSANERYYIKKDFGNWRYQLGAAIRFTF